MSTSDVLRHLERSRPECVSSTADLDQIIDSENLYAAFVYLRRYGGQARGADGLTYGDFSRSEIHDCLRGASEALRCGEYRFQPLRLVRIDKPRPPGATSAPQKRELWIPTVIDRCISFAVHQALTPLLDPGFDDRSYGFRPRRGVWALLRQLSEDIDRHGLTWLAQDDIKQAFPTTPLTVLLNHFSSSFSCPRLGGVIRRMVRFECSQHDVGLYAGDAFAPTALNLVLHNELDTWHQRQDSELLRYRYVDNVAYLCRDAYHAGTVLHELGNRLKEIEMKLKEIPQGVVDLRESHTELLGFALSMPGGRLHLALRNTAWEALERRLADTVRAPDGERLRRQIVGGWIRSFGPAFGSARSATANRIRDVLRRMGGPCPRKDDMVTALGDALQRWTAFLRRQDEVPAGPCAPRRQIVFTDRYRTSGGIVTDEDAPF